MCTTSDYIFCCLSVSCSVFIFDRLGENTNCLACNLVYNSFVCGLPHFLLSLLILVVGLTNFLLYAVTFSKSRLGSDESQQGGWFQMFSVASYMPYFDVDTSDVVERIRESLFPFKGTFNEKIAGNPDL